MEMEHLEKPSIKVISRLDEIIARLGELDIHDEANMEEIEKLQHEHFILTINYDWTDEVFEENGKKGLKNMKGEILVPAIYKDFHDLAYYYIKTRPVVAITEDDYRGLILRDGKGTPITEFIFNSIDYIKNTVHTFAVTLESDPFHGAIMIYNNVVTPYEIEFLYGPENGAFIVENEKKFGIFSYEMGNIYIKPGYDDIYDNGYGTDYIFIKDGVEGRVTMDGQFVSNEEFEALSDEEQDKLFFICSGQRTSALPNTQKLV